MKKLPCYCPDCRAVNKRIGLLETALKAYNTAATKFIDKVNSGRARSTTTYAELSQCRSNALRVLEP